MHDYSSILKTVQKVAVSYNTIKLCILYGSTVQDRLRTDSDIDIAVAVENPLSPDEHVALVHAFSSKLRHEVDILDLHTAQGLVLSEALTKGKVVVCRDQMFLLRLMEQVISYNEDLRPGIDRTLQRRIERFIHG